MGKVIDLDEIDRLEREEENSHYKSLKSKTTIKKDLLEIKDFSKSLIYLNNRQLDKLPISCYLKDNILMAKNMKKIALKRQVKFIGKLLRKIDNIDEIYKIYDVIINNDQDANLLFQRIANIRDNLLDNHKTNDTFNKLIQNFPNLDIQKLRQLIRNHYKEVEKNTTRKSFRGMFLFLKELYF